jgi:hypothetical protein
MGTSNDVRSGGAYVEAYVKQDRLKPQLDEVNRKVRGSISLARTAIGTVGGAAVTGGAAALGAINIVSRAGLGFAKGFSSPIRQSNEATHGLVKAISDLQAALRGLRSPVTELFNRFLGGADSGFLKINNLMRVLKTALNPEQYGHIETVMRRLFDSAHDATKEVKNLTAAQEQNAKSGKASPDWLGKRGPRKPKAPKPHSDYTYIEEHTRKNGTVVKGHYRKNKPKDDGFSNALPKASTAITAVKKFASTVEQSKAPIDKAAHAIIAMTDKLPPLGRELSRLAVPTAVGALKLTGDAAVVAGNQATKAAKGFMTAFSHAPAGQIAASSLQWARLFGTTFQVEAAKQALKAADKGRIAFATNRSLAEGVTAWTIINTRRGLMAGLNGTLPAIKSLTVGLTQRLVSGLVGASKSIKSAAVPQSVTDVGNAANTAAPKIEKAAKATVTATQAMREAGTAGGGLISGWNRLTLVAGGLLGAVAKLSSDSADAAKKAATSMGVTVEKASQLGASAELAGTNLDAVTNAVTHLRDGLKHGGEAFESYGLSVEQLKSQSPDERLRSVASLLKSIRDPALKAQAAIDLLGSADLVPLADKFDELQEKSKSLGAVLSDAQATALTDLKSSFAELWVASKSVGSTFASEIAPAVSGLARMISDFTSKNQALLTSLFGMARKAVVAAVAIRGIASVAKTMATVWPLITPVLAAVLSPLGLLTAAAIALVVAFDPLRTVAMEVFAAMEESASAALGPIMEILNALSEDFSQVWSGVIDAIAAGDLELAGQIAMNGLLVVFDQGWALVRSGFFAFRNYFLDAFDWMISEVRIAADSFFPGFETAWVNTIGFIADAWTVLVNGLVGGFDRGATFIMKWINYLKSFFVSAFDWKAANKEIDEGFDQRVKERQADQDKALTHRENGRKNHLQNVEKNGLRGTLEDENLEAMQLRKVEADAAKRSDLEELARAREKLKISVDRAAKEREAKEIKSKKDAETGAETAKSGIAASNRKGVEANDVRTKEGLSSVAATARGNSPLEKQLDVSKMSLAEQKKQTDLQWKQWKQMQAGLTPQFPLKG